MTHPTGNTRKPALHISVPSRQVRILSLRQIGWTSSIAHTRGTLGIVIPQKENLTALRIGFKAHFNRMYTARNLNKEGMLINLTGKQSSDLVKVFLNPLFLGVSLRLPDRHESHIIANRLKKKLKIGRDGHLAFRFLDMVSHSGPNYSKTMFTGKEGAPLAPATIRAATPLCVLVGEFQQG